MLVENRNTLSTEYYGQGFIIIKCFCLVGMLINKFSFVLISLFYRQIFGSVFNVYHLPPCSTSANPLTRFISKYVISFSFFCLNYSSSIHPCPLTSFFFNTPLPHNINSLLLHPIALLFHHFPSTTLHASLYLKLPPPHSPLSSLSMHPPSFHIYLGLPALGFNTSSFLHPLPWQRPPWQRAWVWACFLSGQPGRSMPALWAGGNVLHCVCAALTPRCGSGLNAGSLTNQ